MTTGYTPASAYPPTQQQYYGAVQPQPSTVGIGPEQQRTNERRHREQRQNHICAGMLCGGCFIALCVGVDRAADCGVKIMDRLLCMDVHCWGF